jgi:hypothetical protein
MTPAPAGLKAFMAGNNQTTLQNLTTVKPALVIPKVPFHPIPARVAQAFPELAAWNSENHAKLEAWRVQTNVAIYGTAPPP